MRPLAPALLAVALLAPGLTGCRKTPVRPPAAVGNAEAIVAAARQAQPAQTLRARFKLKVDGPTVDGGTRAGFVLDRPDRLRVDVLTPLGTPMLLLATDGTAMNAWVQRDATFLRGDDAVAVLQQVTGGVIGLPDLLDLLVGRLPLAGADVLDLRPTPEGVQVVLHQPDLPDFRVRAVIDPADLRLRALDVAPAAGPAPTDLGAPVFTVRIPGVTGVDGHNLPAALVVTLPTLGWTLSLDFQSWEALDAPPDVFTLPVPPGATEKDLVETLRRLGDGGGAHR